MPKMGESIEEATITNWFVKEGDRVEEDDVLLEIATDKVDSEIPSPVEGILKKILFKQDEVVAVGTVIAVIDMEGEESAPDEMSNSDLPDSSAELPGADKEINAELTSGTGDIDTIEDKNEVVSSEGRFYSPLVRKIAREEGVSQKELDSIHGSGANGRVQKNDILNYIETKKDGAIKDKKELPSVGEKDEKKTTSPEQTEPQEPVSVPVSKGAEDEVIEMSRLRKLIAAHMIHSKQTSAHVTNMIEVDATGVVKWRNATKDSFLKKEGVKLTYLPVFLEATVKTLKDYPQINASVDGDKIILKKKINLGIAVALPDNNLIVPNIKDADSLNLTGITKKMNELAVAARANKLSPDDISGGTFTVTNFGTFQNDIGTPIINQPEVAILAVGAIKKKPAVLETEQGDVIAIRHKMWLSLTYDHRIVDGALGGAFLKRLGDYIESFNPENGNIKLK